ncbi:MAG: ParB/RepB/Spo0J family partition protein [Eubacteriaceae bacterium]|jgi:ParB family chromosome partitioning protein
MSNLSETKIYNIPTDQILPNPNQPRKHFDQAALEELAESIRSYGLISPIQVRRINDDLFELVAGERRLRAAKIAGLTTVPAVLVSITDEDSAVIAIMENIQRENLSYFEEARSYAQLIEYYGMTQEKIARALGKSQSFIANKIRLLKLDPLVVDKIVHSNMTERHARALLRLPDTDLQLEVIEKITGKDFTVKKTEELVEKIRKDVLTNNYEEKITPDKKARVKSFINAQIYVNTIKSAFKMVKDSKATARYQETDKDDCIEIKITIPK